MVKAKAENRNADIIKHLHILEALSTANGWEAGISERKLKMGNLLHVTVFRGANALLYSSQFTSKLAYTQLTNHFLYHR